jgi:2-keto-4-pentenoate hydratase/2-oxohepta-3-ene-1,7-dioic acid hydratase in catechol pathway
MDESQESINIRLLLPAIGISTVFIIGIFFAFQYSKSHVSPTAPVVPTPTQEPLTAPAQKIPIPTKASLVDPEAL